MTNIQHLAATDVATWLLRRSNVSVATPLIVEIDGDAWPAARYIENHNGVDADRIYLLSTTIFHPKAPPLCFRADDSEYAWHFVAWFRQMRPCRELKEVHPFGPHFILELQSPLEHWAANQCSKEPIRCLPMRIMPISGPTDVRHERNDDQR